MEITGKAQLRAWQEGLLPDVEQVWPGLWSIPVPLPDNPLRYVLVYALELAHGVALIDAGWDTEEAWEALAGGLTAIGVRVSDVQAVLITHIHPDHYGLAGRIREASGAWIGLHPEEAATLPTRFGVVDPLVDQMRALLAECGVAGDELNELATASLGVNAFVRQVKPDVLIEDGARVDLPGWDVRAIWTPGHTPGHLCFYVADHEVLLTGDHVLPRISPSVSLHVQQRGNPLADFLDSLRKVAKISVAEVLPAHEYRFRGLDDRVDTLLRHHQDRLTELSHLLRQHPGSTCWELTRRLSWSRPWGEIQPFMRRAANGETLAHLVLLELQDTARREGTRPVRWHHN